MYIMVLAGFGMFLGNLVGGRMADRFTPGKTAVTIQSIVTFALLAIFFTAQHKLPSVAFMFVCTAGLFAVSSPLQISIIHYSKGGELLGAACLQVAFNLGNAWGAYVGGLPIDAGLGYTYPALIAVPFSFLALVLLLWFTRRYEKARL